MSTIAQTAGTRDPSRLHCRFMPVSVGDLPKGDTETRDTLLSGSTERVHS
jgi:hypothetical protein